MGELGKEKFGEVVAYIEQLKFHKTLFGIDERDLYETIETLHNYYEKMAALFEGQLQNQVRAYEVQVSAKAQEAEIAVKDTLTMQKACQQDQETIEELEKTLERMKSQSQDRAGEKDAQAAFFSAVQAEKDELLRVASARAYRMVEKAKDEVRQRRRRQEATMKKREGRQRQTLEQFQNVKARVMEKIEEIYGMDYLDVEFKEIKTLLADLTF